MKPQTLYSYLTLHTWVGILSGLVLFIGFYAGSLTMFKDAIDRWATPPAPQSAPLSLQDMDRLIAHVVTHYPDAAKGLNVDFRTTENAVAPLVWDHGTFRADYAPDGSIAVTQAEPSRLAELIDLLHQTAGIPGSFENGHDHLGVYVMGVASMLYFLALVSGVVIILKNWWRDLFALRIEKREKRRWLDVHVLLGLGSIPFHFVIALTVIVFAFHDLFYDALGKVVMPERAPQAKSRPAAPPQPKPLASMTTVLENVRALAPEFTPTRMLYRGLDGQRPMLRMGGTDPRYMVRGAMEGFAIIDPYSGAVLDAQMLPGSESGWGATVGTFFALHFGSFGGDLIRWVYFVLGLAGAVLFYSGNLLWIISRQKKSPNRHVAALASLSIGVTLGSVLGVAVALAATKWLSGSGVTDWYFPLYYTLFLAAVAWSFYRGAGNAAVDLLGLIALACFAVPMQSLLAPLFPELLWAPRSAAALGVDLAAALFGLCFSALAYFTARRLAANALHSVWQRRLTAEAK